MLTAASYAIIGATIVGANFISGVFGIAGGMILLGVLLVFLDVTTAMLLFTILQLTGNAWRTLHWRQHIRWPIFWRYALGATIAFGAMRYIAYVPDKAVVYILLGLLPFLVEAFPARLRPSIEWRGVPLFTGLATTFLQFVAGAGGLFLDIFFQKSLLDRKTVNATKAATQTFSTVLRGLYFGSMAGTGSLTPAMLAPAIGLAIFGSMLAPLVLERMTDTGFRKWTRMIIFAVAGVSLVRGGMLLWAGT
jgi:uncharacterized membrane protein YfcA